MLRGLAGAITAIFKSKEENLGKIIGLAGDKKTAKEFEAIMNKYIAPKKLAVVDVSTPHMQVYIVI